MGIKTYCIGLLFLCGMCNVAFAGRRIIHWPPHSLSKVIGHGNGTTADAGSNSVVKTVRLSPDGGKDKGCAFFGFDLDEKLDLKVVKLDPWFHGFAEMSILKHKGSIEGLRFLRFEPSMFQKGAISNWVESVAQDFLQNGAFTFRQEVDIENTGDCRNVIMGEALIAEISGVNSLVNCTNGVIYGIWIRRRHAKGNRLKKE